MRTLTSKQKKLIREWFNQHKALIETVGGGLVKEWQEYPFFSFELFEQLKEINDTEILSQNISNYIQELVGGD